MQRRSRIFWNSNVTCLGFANGKSTIETPRAVSKRFSRFFSSIRCRIAATGSGHLGGAILDVFRTEPLPSNHPFWTAPGIMVLPHIGGGHPERDRTVAKLFVDNLSRFLDGKPLREVVDRAAGY